MKTTTTLIRGLVAAALVCGASVSQASLSIFTNEASFLAAVSAPGTDSFDDLTVFDNPASPLSRSAGSYTYSASVSSSSFFNVGSPADIWLSTDDAAATVTFNLFSSGVSAIGGFFFATDFDGAFLANQSIQLAAVDADGSLMQIINEATLGASFLGFVSTGSLNSLTVTALQPTFPTWPTINNLTLAAALPQTNDVPEPHSGLLLLSSMGILSLAGRRRSRRTVKLH